MLAAKPRVYKDPASAMQSHWRCRSKKNNQKVKSWTKGNTIQCCTSLHVICTTCKFWQLVEHGRKAQYGFWWTAHPNCVKNIQNIPKTTESIWVPLGCFLMLESIGICSKMFKIWPVVAASASESLQKPDETIAARRGYTLCLGALGRPAAPGALPGAASLATWGARRRSAWWKLATKPGAVKIS